MSNQVYKFNFLVEDMSYPINKCELCQEFMIIKNINGEYHLFCINPECEKYDEDKMNHF